MTRPVTIATFTYPSELAVIRARLESEGIECFAADELTVQVYNLMSNAMGGIRLQVDEKDAVRATELLKEWGQIPEEEPGVGAFWIKFNRLTHNLPWIGKLQLQLRFLVLLGIIGLTPLPFLYASLVPSVKSQLMSQNWCVNYITFDGQYFEPKTIENRERNLTSESCSETLMFARRVMIIPGFQSRPVMGKWELIDDEVYISELDTFEHIFEGFYAIEINDQTLVLTSEHTTIHCKMEAHP
ncbi:DUF2007 domain-containing protein [bacterium SCSIO 12741]|nr:DUF2007 domain-containing protein [bacterium SCSIO 12741]